MTSPIIDSSKLYSMKPENTVVIDCRFSLENPEKGHDLYKKSHIPGSFYAHLERDLSSKHIPGVTGRHPLPDPCKLWQQFSTWGIEHHKNVVCYDQKNSVFASRFWWLLKWSGHQSVFVLDGGFSAWERHGFPTTSAIQTSKSALFNPQKNDDMVVDAEQLERLMTRSDVLLIDARAPLRYKGIHEPLDPVAGHIPGAINLPFIEMVNEDGLFLHKEVLVKRFSALFKNHTPETGVVYCGSGVSATHIILTFEHCGFYGSRMYAGSWSEWITNSARPVATWEDRVAENAI